MNIFNLVLFSLVVGILIFVSTQNILFIFSQNISAQEFAYKTNNFISIIERISKLDVENFYHEHFLGLANVSIKNNVLKVVSGKHELSYYLPFNVEDTEIINKGRICIIKNKEKITIRACDEIQYLEDNGCSLTECRTNSPDCKGPNKICINDGYCNTFIGENCRNSNDCSCSIKGLNYICCPEHPNSEKNGCVKISEKKKKGEECICNDECSEGLSCNPVTSSFTEYKKACCENGKRWNGKDCVLESYDVLIVALKSKLKTVYSDSQISLLENKIKEFSETLLNYDKLNSLFIYLDEDQTSDLIGFKVTNPEDWNNIDGVIEALVKKVNSKYLIIIGGYHRFPQPELYFPGWGEQSSPQSDDPYADIDKDGNYMLDIAIGRIPDPENGDINIFIKTLDTAINLHKNGGIELVTYVAPIMGCGGYDDEPWISGKCFCEYIWGHKCLACGNCCGCLDYNSLSNKDFAMILAHGPGPASHDLLHGGCIYVDGTSWMLSLDVSNSFWMSMACGGGHIKLKKDASNSILMTFLKLGGAIYIGSTDLNIGLDIQPYICIVPGGDGLIGSLYTEIVSKFSIGKRVGDAFKEGKNEYFRKYKVPYLFHISTFYGDPTLKIKNLWS